MMHDGAVVWGVLGVGYGATVAGVDWLCSVKAGVLQEEAAEEEDVDDEFDMDDDDYYQGENYGACAR